MPQPLLLTKRPRNAKSTPLTNLFVSACTHPFEVWSPVSYDGVREIHFHARFSNELCAARTVVDLGRGEIRHYALDYPLTYSVCKDLLTGRHY